MSEQNKGLDALVDAAIEFRRAERTLHLELEDACVSGERALIVEVLERLRTLRGKIIDGRKITATPCPRCGKSGKRLGSCRECW